MAETGISTDSELIKDSGSLKRGLKFIYVYALATGAILTFIGYWDGVFLTNNGPGTFLAFALMTLMVLPIAYVYSEMASMFPNVGAELVYNTIGINKHFGFWSSWLILAAWIAVPPAAVMGILSWINFEFIPDMSYETMITIGIIILIIFTAISLLKNVVAGAIQTFMLFSALIGIVLTAVLFIFSDHWSWSNMIPFFRSSLAGGGALGEGGFKGWLVGLGLIVTPYFGFETVPQMVEEGTFPIKNMYKAILGSVITCGVLYVIIFFALAGMEPWETLTEYGTSAPFAAIKVIYNNFVWRVYGLFYGVVAVLFTIGTCILGFWISAVRLLYAMGRQNFLPEVFAKTNRFGQPIVPNLFILGVSMLFFALMSAYTYLEDFFSLMAFACAAAYTITMISAIKLANDHPEWERPYRLKGGQKFRIFALIIAAFITFMTTLGQNFTAWQGIFMYMGIGVVIWLWMIMVKWKKDKVWMMTPEGPKKY